jgi:hypothetical protein
LPTPAEKTQQAAAEMADVILTALEDYGPDFEPDDLLAIAQEATDHLPIDALVDVIVCRLALYGAQQEVAAGFQDDAFAATWGRLGWAEILAEVDHCLPLLDGKSRPPREPDDIELVPNDDPPHLMVKGGKVCECDCGYKRGSR